MVSPQTAAISSISQCTIDLPATFKSGFGVVRVWGLMRLPIPAIGIINLMRVFVSKKGLQIKGYFVKKSLRAGYLPELP